MHLSACRISATAWLDCTQVCSSVATDFLDLPQACRNDATGLLEHPKSCRSVTETCFTYRNPAATCSELSGRFVGRMMGCFKGFHGAFIWI